MRSALPRCSAFAVALLTSTPVLAEEATNSLVVSAVRAPESATPTASGTIAPPHEVPQTILTVPPLALTVPGASRLDDAYGHVSGVHRQNSFGGLWDNPAIRGFAGNADTGPAMLRDGLPANRGFMAPRDLANVERVEILKGASGARFGSSEPGGVINVVTKKPDFTSHHAAGTSLDSEGAYRVTADSRAPLHETTAYRLNAVWEDGPTFRDHSDRRRWMIAPALAVRPLSQWSLGYDGEFLHHAAPLDRGVVAVGGDIRTIPRSRFLGEPGDGDITIRNTAHVGTSRFAFSPEWAMNTSFSHRRTSLDGYSTEASPRTAGQVRWTTAGEPILERERRYRDYASRDNLVSHEFQGQFHTGTVGHDLRVGLEVGRLELDQLMRRGRSTTTYGIDITNPVYGQTPLALTATPTNSEELQRHVAVSFQDHLSLGKSFRVLLGVRRDRYRQEITNLLPGGVSIDQDLNATSPRAGLTWLPHRFLSVSTLVARSFRPNVGLGADGASFDPEIGTSREVSARVEIPDTELVGTLAVYDIDKRNVLIANSANPGFQEAAGAVGSRGIEADIGARWFGHLRTDAHYALTDARVTEDAPGTPAGTPLINIPRHSGGGTVTLEGPVAGQSGGVGIGGQFLADRPGNSLDTFRLPGYALFSAHAFVDLGNHTRLACEVENLFDTVYAASSYDVFWVTPGAPRTVTVSLNAFF